ncbi:GNAT family N-acetyltransferase [Metasolibacillus meyeri]|uniref:GNAT family N-acetyltransferase n=1 Tax=Metasolibacillus meyeri TaxID=1071052 RepID=UPI001EE6DA24|nr:GNAT family N-acetyltransferase [Metasolibacillus meyeri]
MSKKMEKKYIPLAEFFQNATQNEITLTYEAIENIMGQALPNAAYLNLSWWKKTKPPLTHYQSWFNANYNVIDVQLGQSVKFSRLKQAGNEENGTDENTQASIIRPIETEDARSFIRLQEQIYEQSDFEYYEPNVQHLTVQVIRKQMAEWRKFKRQTILLCIVNGEFAGYSRINGYKEQRLQHVAAIRIGVLKNYENTGIGTSLLENSIKWAKQNGIERLEAVIMSHNSKAIALFEKQGFTAEGKKIHAVKIDNEYYDEIMYSKLI